MDSKYIVSDLAKKFICEIIARKMSISEAEEALSLAQEKLKQCTVSEPGIRETEEIEKALNEL